MPAAVAALAKSAFSDKNPYPGTMALTLFRFAISIIWSLIGYNQLNGHSQIGEEASHPSRYALDGGPESRTAWSAR